jgi:hypothetical protein
MKNYLFGHQGSSGNMPQMSKLAVTPPAAAPDATGAVVAATAGVGSPSTETRRMDARAILMAIAFS